MSSVTSNYEETLRSMRTGKNESSPLTNLKRFMTWGQDTESLPYSNKTDTTSAGQGSILSWPPWAGSGSSQPAPFYDTFGLSTMQRYAAFGMCILGAALLFFLAIMHLPLVIIRPSKFVVPYCLSNILLFVSFGFLHGFVSYIRHLFSQDKWPFSTAFIGTTCGTLYVAMVMKMYALTIPMAICQFIAMCAFVISYIPGGSAGISTFGSFAGSSLRSRIAGF